MSYRGREVPPCGVTGAPRAKRLVVVARRVERRQAGHCDIGALRRLPQRTLLDGMPLSVAVWMAHRLLVRQTGRRGTRNARVFHNGLKMNAGCRDAIVHHEVTHRGLGTDGVRIQQTEEEQAQSQHTPQSR